MLASPSMNMDENMIKLGSINIYPFEISLLAAFAVSFLAFLAGSRQVIISKNILSVYFLFCSIGVIGFIGAIMYATVEVQTILKDFRQILYWLAGVVIIFSGHKHLRLKTLSWVIAAGLLMQICMGVILVIMDPSILYLNGFRFPISSGWLTLYFVAIFITVITYKKALLRIQKYNIVPITILLIPLLTSVLLAQNRTTWIAFFLMILSFLIFYGKFADKIKLLGVTVVFLMVITIALQIIPYGESFKNYLGQRLFESTLSGEGIRDSYEGNREVIYKSNLKDFLSHPIIGNGFGHQLYFDFSSYGKVEDREQSSSDNSFVNVVLKTGLIGLSFFLFILLKIYSEMKHKLAVMVLSEEWIYLKAMLFVFPFFALIALNISIFYGYPEVMIFSLFFAKAALMKPAP